MNTNTNPTLTAGDRNQPQRPRWMPSQSVATKIALAYAAAGALWILGSDWLVHRVVTDPAAENHISMVKGWVYVAITSLLLWWVLSRYFQIIRRSARLLQESERRWQFALDGAGHGVWDWNVQTNEVVFSPRVATMLGYAPEEFGQDLTAWEQRVHPEDLARVRAELTAHLDGRAAAYATEHRLRCKDGSYKWVLDQGKVMTRDAAERPVRVIGTHTDISERKAAEEQAARLHRQNDYILNSAAEGILGLDLEDRHTFVNAAAARMLGYAPEELLGQPAHATWHHTHADGSRYPREDCLIYAAARRGSVQRVSTEVFWRKDGTSFPVEYASTPILEQGRMVGMVVSFSDITERKRAETLRQVLLSLGETLNTTRRPQEAARAVLAAAGQLWRWDAATLNLVVEQAPQVRNVVKVDTINGQRRELYEATQMEMTPFLARVIRDGAQLVLRGEAGGAPDDLVPFGDVQRRSASIMAVPIRREGRHEGMLSLQSYQPRAYTQADMATLQALADYCASALARLRFEEELQASEQRFRTLVEHAPMGIFIHTAGRFDYLNATALRLLGAEAASQLLATRVLERFLPEQRGELEARLINVTSRDRDLAAVEARVRRLDGGEMEAEFFAVPFQYNLQPGTLVFFQEISGRKRLEAQFRQAQKLEAIGQLAGGVAHDFNNILAATMMHLGLLQMNSALDAETLQALRELEVEARRAAALTRQLLMFSRRSVLTMKPLDLNEIVANLLKMLTRLIGEHIELHSEGTAGLPLVEADAGMVEQVIVNLVVNARDAMPKGGHITIRTSVAVFSPAEAQLWVDRRPGRFVCLAVVDTGIGMSAETIKHIFEPFFTTKEAGQGTGLGLATVHGIVAQHQGWVEVESKLGAGAVFRIYLPALPEVAALPANTTETTTLRRGRESILLAEDDAWVRLSVAQFLRLLGYQVFEAATGREAMQVWQEQQGQVDLLLTDMIMPEGMTGLELAEQLQARKPNLQVIISSGYSAEIVQAGVPNRPGIVYLPKPHEIKQLADLVRQCLDRKAKS